MDFLTNRFNRHVLPACLYQSNENPITEPEVLGWGHTSFAGSSSDVLLKGFLTIVNNTECNKSYEEDDSELPQGIISSQICAWDPDGKRDTW